MFRFAGSFGFITLLAACTSTTAAVPTRPAPEADSFPLSATGWRATASGIEVDLDVRCVTTTGAPCDEPARTVRFVLITPWGASLDGSIEGKRATTLPLTRARAVFALDWSALWIDPLVPGGTDKLTGRWTLAALGIQGELRWLPSARERDALVTQVSELVGIETGVRTDQPPPDLQVGALDVDRERSALRLTVTNGGAGPGYRVYARTRSSEPALHGLQISFGRIDPGATETRAAEVTLPKQPRRPEATVVLEFYEANAHFPDAASRRVHIGPLGPVPSLSLACRHGGVRLDAAPLNANAGARLRLECTVQNAGSAAASAVRLRISVGKRVVGTTEPVELAPSQSEVVIVSVRVPGDATPERPVPIEIHLELPGTHAAVVERGSIEVGLPALCPEGRITRDQYEEKRATIEAAARDGHLTRQEFERYDAELVRCLQ